MAKKRSGNKGVNELVDVLIYVLFGSVVIPLIAYQMLTIEGDTANFSATEIVLFGLVTTILSLGFVYSIVKRFF